MKKSITILFLLLNCVIYSQVGIGTSSPDPSAILDITATDKGVLIPRVALVDISNTAAPISIPSSGLMVWNTNASVVGGNGVGFYYFNGTIWVAVNTNTSNTLDGAYDAGGAGAGRIITADANPVRISGSDGFWVTGTHGNGNLLEASTTNSKMFFYPRKSAFRAGFEDSGSWSEANIGQYSAALGRNTTASGNYSFAVGEVTTASGQYSSAFGTFTNATGSASVAFGNATTASGSNSLSTGVSSIASGDNSMAAGSNLFARSYGEVAVGIFNTDYVPNSAIAFNANDRVFSVGYGSGAGTRRNAFEAFKNGTIRINNNYNLPTVDGTANQVLVTDGAGNLSWANQVNNSNITVIPVYAANATELMNYPAFANVIGCRSGVIPSLFNLTGNVQVKLMIRYTASTGNISDCQMRLVANDGVTTNNIITEANGWTNTPTSIGGIYSSDWVNWNASLNPYQINLRAQTISPTSDITIANVYVMIKSQ